MSKMVIRSLELLAAVVLLCSLVATVSADVTVTGVTVSPESVEVGENVTITASVENTGNTTETVPIVFKINGEEVKSVNVTVEANATETVECMVAEDEAGTYEVTVNGASASFTVTAPATPTPTPEVTPSPSSSPTPSPTPSPTATITPTTTSVPTTLAPSEEKFRVGPIVKLRPLNDVACPREDGLIELYMSNPSLNDVTLTTEVWVEIPSGIHVTGEGFTADVAAGVAHALFEVTPGTSKNIHVNIKPIGSYEDKEVFIHAYGYYWPGHNKDNSYPISLTHPFKIRKVCLSPSPTSSPTTSAPTQIPGFKAIFAIAGLLAVAYLVGRKNK
ncbi:hypothetical protein CW714_07470 [Methanophagales archaeon]|nr:MAG: hypothetical protein CW714_07470 [Methanophagales archaeon]